MLFFVRHGDTDYNLGNDDFRHVLPLDSDTDCDHHAIPEQQSTIDDWRLVLDLSESGLDQVRSSAQEMARLIYKQPEQDQVGNANANEISVKILTSPLGRCIHTAHVILEELQKHNNNKDPNLQHLCPAYAAELMETSGFKPELRKHVTEIEPHLRVKDPKLVGEAPFFHTWRSNEIRSVLEDAGDNVSSEGQEMLLAIEDPQHSRKRLWHILGKYHEQANPSSNQHVILVGHGAGAVFAWEAHYHTTAILSEHCFLARGPYLALQSPVLNTENDAGDDSDDLGDPDMAVCPKLVLVETNEPSFQRN